MTTPQQSSPLLTRSPDTRESRGSSAFDARPYLVTSPNRKTRAVQQHPALFPHEPEDARLTGATRSLYRRLLALNLPGKIVPATVTAATAGEINKSAYSGFKIA
jgi:hypothetical protein